MSLRAAVTVRRGGFVLDARLDVDDGEVVAVLGPNGAGKTTLLGALAGLVPVDEGRVVLDDVVLEDVGVGVRVPAARRPVGVVFQDGRLFPHLTVVENVAFGLRARGVRHRKAVAQARSWLERVGVADALECKPDVLSGGQAQRVALARALVTRPRLLLLDEPLAAVDAGARASLRRQIGESLGDVGGTRVLVTHDPVDAMALARRLVILEGGRVVQEGAPADVRRRPRSPFAAELVGVNLFRGRARGGVVHLEGGGTIVAAPGAPDGDVFSLIHPHAVALHRHRPEGTPRNAWLARADAVDLAGDRARVQIRGPVPLVAEVTQAAVDELRLAQGGEVWATVKATEVRVYEA
ncbi:MAG: ABC transporter ATP-binding protein [Acidimicrobiia bacterium]|nr:ABC transporter ATP-binding protein [Acidimicrobiia bacterium]